MLCGSLCCARAALRFKAIAMFSRIPRNFTTRHNSQLCANASLIVRCCNAAGSQRSVHNCARALCACACVQWNVRVRRSICMSRWCLAQTRRAMTRWCRRAFTCDFNEMRISLRKFRLSRLYTCGIINRKVFSLIIFIKIIVVTRILSGKTLSQMLSIYLSMVIYKKFSGVSRVKWNTQYYGP